MNKIHQKAILWNMTFLLLFYSMYGKSWRQLIQLFTNYDAVSSVYGSPVGFLPGSFNLVVNIIHLVITNIALFLSFSLMTKSEWARKKIVVFIPLLALFGLHSFLIGYLKEPFDTAPYFAIGILIGAIVCFGLGYTFYKIYQSQWMKAFFNDHYETHNLTKS